MGNLKIVKPKITYFLNGEDFIINKRLIDLINSDLDLSPIDRLVFIELTEHFGEGIAPPQKELAEKLNVSDRSIRKSIKQLENGGWIKKEHFKDAYLQTNTKYDEGEQLLKVIEEVL